MKNETNIDVLNEYTERRIRAYLASMVPRDELSTEEERGRSLIEQIALSAHGDDHPPIRLSADRCADVLDFIASVEPLEPWDWWKSPEHAPCHVTGMTLVLGTLVESLRARTETREPAQPKPDESDIPTLQEVRTVLEGAFESIDTHVTALEMACYALKHTESEGDPERIAKVFNEVIIPHLREQVYDTLYELAERIPATQEAPL